MAYQTIRWEVANGVGTLTFDRPDVYNSFNDDMSAEVLAALKEAAKDPAVRCVVITGSGRAFCAGQDLNSRNVAVVMVTSMLPPFAEPGQKLDVSVSSFGDAHSLSGGTLLLTPLDGPDGQLYALAQGPLSVGGYDGMHLIYAALKKAGPNATGDQLLAAMKGASWTSPRGPMSIDPQTRDVVQNVYIRKAEKVDGQIYNVEFDKIEHFKDPGV